jgi:hypothetical protein
VKRDEDYWEAMEDHPKGMEVRTKTSMEEVNATDLETNSEKNKRS